MIVCDVSYSYTKNIYTHSARVSMCVSECVCVGESAQYAYIYNIIIIASNNNNNSIVILAKTETITPKNIHNAISVLVFSFTWPIYVARTTDAEKRKRERESRCMVGTSKSILLRFERTVHCLLAYMPESEVYSEKKDRTKFCLLHH